MRNSDFEVVFEPLFDYIETMSRIAKSIGRTASLALLAGVVHAAVTETAENQYKVILTRNVFALKPPPIVEPVKLDEVGPPPNIKLTGIIAITNPKKAMFMVTPVKGEPSYLTVNEGEESDGTLLKVLEIDEQLGTVKIVMNGATHTLDFEKNGIKTPAVAAAPPLARPTGLPSIPGMAQPGGIPPAPSGGGVPIQFNSKSTATPSNPGQPTAPSLQNIPTRSLRTQPQTQLGPTVPDKPLSAPESYLLKKANELVNQDNKQYPPPLPAVPELENSF